MEQIKFPLSLNFKISTLANDFTLTDADGQVQGYVRQKMFRLIEQIEVFTDTSRNTLLYTISANKWLDFSTTYVFRDAHGTELGRVARKGWSSLWRANYHVHDAQGSKIYTIREGNPWVKVLDGLLGEIPVVGMLTGYFANPTYHVQQDDGSDVLILRKLQSFFGRRFRIEQAASARQAAHYSPMVLSLMMVVLLERRRG